MSKGNHGQTGAYSLTIRESEGSREERVDGINTLDQEKKNVERPSGGQEQRYKCAGSQDGRGVNGWKEQTVLGASR